MCIFYLYWFLQACVRKFHLFFTLRVAALKSPVHHTYIVQIIFSFWSFEISEDILRNQDISFGLDRTFLTNIMIMDNTSLPIDYPGEGANVNGQ